MRSLKQIRYLGSTGVYNNVNDINALLQANTFLNSEQAVSVGVQAPEKTVFLINGESITMGKTGIFEWTVENIPGEYIKEFKFGGTLNSSANYIVDFCLES